MFEFLQFTFVFLSVFIMLAGTISMYAQNMSLVVLNSMLMFMAVTVATGYDFFETLLILFTIVISIYCTFMIYEEFFGSEGGIE